MRFLFPSLLAWSVLLLAAVALYLFRRRPKTVRVSTLPFFKSLAREHQESAWLRRLKQLLSFLLSAAVILACVAALARLVVSPPADALSTVVLLVDRSASMAAVDADGRTRLEAALAEVRSRLAGLPNGVGCIVMAYDRRPEILLPRSLDRREVERALSAIEVRPIDARPDDALRLAGRLAALDTPAVVWHASDGGEAAASQTEVGEEAAVEDEPAAEDPVVEAAPAAESLPSADAAEGVPIELIAVALPRPKNVGLTAFQLRRQPLSVSQWEAFVELHYAGDEPAEAQLEVRLDGTLTEVRRLEFQPGGRQRLLIPVDGRQWRTVTLTASLPGDVLPLDNELFARVPDYRPIRVAWISESPDPFTQLALTSLGDESGVEVVQGAPAAWPPVDLPDVVIFDGWLPDQWPADVAAIVIDPPRSLGPVQAVRLEAALPLDGVRAAQPGHAVLYGVATARVALAQTAVLETSGPVQPLWTGPSGPVLSAGEAAGQRLVVLAFAPQLSEQLPLLASYPLLMGNAIFWTAQPKFEAQEGVNHRTGDLLELAGKSIAWSQPRGPEAEQDSAELSGRWTEMDRIGLWETDAGEAGSAALLARGETLIAPAADAESSSVAVAAGPFAWLQGDLSALLLWGALGVLLVESLLFHRWAIY